MKEGLLFIGIISICTVQVALGPFLMVLGHIIPLVYLYLWSFRNSVSGNVFLIMAFISGLFLDALATPVMGVHTLGLLISSYIILYYRQKTRSQEWWRKVVLFVVAGVVYWGTGVLLQSWLA